MAKKAARKSAAGKHRMARQTELVRTESGHVSLQQQYRDFAHRQAAGEILVPPTLLPDEERRLHIRQTLLEDHAHRIHNRPEGAHAKFNELAKSPFKFFRGTALLYYRDYAGSDAHLPIVFAIGDVHPENFGVMPNEDGAPYFGIDDFDEAAFAPFTWDVKRGAVGFLLAARASGRGRKARRAAVNVWVDGYLAGLREFVRNDTEATHQFRLDNSPPIIKRLLQDVISSRNAFLKSMIDMNKGLFIATDEIVPYSKHVEEFQRAIDEYRKVNDIDTRGRGGHFHVKDVALKKGSGTASLGLDRYFVLIDGPTDDPFDDVILEIKQARQSALLGLTPVMEETQSDGEAARIVESHRIHMAGGDAYYGMTTLNGISHLVRERSPFKGDIDVDDLDDDELCEYAHACGLVLAQAHARSDREHGVDQQDMESQILDALQPKVFQDDIWRFAKVAAKRIKRDYQLFQKDHALSVYEIVSQL